MSLLHMPAYQMVVRLQEGGSSRPPWLPLARGIGHCPHLMCSLAQGTRGHLRSEGEGDPEVVLLPIVAIEGLLQLLVKGRMPRFEGQLMRMLDHFYFGYSVSWGGGVVGGIGGLVDGAIGGFVFAWLYNKLSGAQ